MYKITKIYSKLYLSPNYTASCRKYTVAALYKCAYCLFVHYNT